ncbi:MAG: D-glycerate dehydrogenase [Thermoanaerobaculia bacterium]|nr:D-glycerate dehydrogenase [Thermoanaerobaculia bacterium]
MPRKVLVTRRIPRAGLELLAQADCDVTVLQHDEERGLSRQELLHSVGGCDVLLPLLTEPIDRQLMESHPALLGIAQMAVGFDNIDVAAATELGIPVANTPEVLTEATADFTWAMLMSVARRVPAAHDYMQSGRYKIWGPNLFLGADVGSGPDGVRKVLGIVGYGRIGEAVARRATGFDMEILAHDPSKRAIIEADEKVHWAELEELLRRADFVTLHPPLTPRTRHLIDGDALSRMKPTAFLINAARGPIVDESALVDALRSGQIAGAALDVYEDEPEMASGLAVLDNVVLFPHIASATDATRSRMAAMAATNAVAHLEGEKAPNCVNPEVYGSPVWRQRRRRRSI